ncbi:tRNA-splicing endonuclease subunit [Borealophlyctis nickersoniae]|nr:tRNA-splicing endonuclease subunit [Borealophlyctis nickersoniae]
MSVPEPFAPPPVSVWGPSSPPRPITISVANGKAYVWDAGAVLELRSRYHIVGALVGTLPRMPLQNTFYGLPLSLMPEEVTLLLERGYVHLVDEGLSYHAPSAEDMKKWDDSRAEEAREYARAKKIAADALREQKIAAAKMNGLGPRLGPRAQDGASAEPEGAAVGDAGLVAGTSETAKRNLDEGLTSFFDDSGAAEDSVVSEPPASSSPSPLPSTAPQSTSTSVASRPTHVPFPVSTPTSSTSLPWYNEGVDELVPTTLDDARAKGIWTWPRTQSEQLRYKVFRGLWERGYYITSGSKFGGDYLMYPGEVS